MTLNRRDFMKTLAGGVMSLCGLGSLTNEKSLDNRLPYYDSNFSVPELELVGKKPPVLCGDNYNLRERASKAFSAMREAAEKDGINIYPIVGHRSFDHQLSNWNGKFQDYIEGAEFSLEAVHIIMRYLSIPGTSRHHWGTEVDIIENIEGIKEKIPEGKSVLNQDHFKPGGIFKNLGNWLEENAHKYGFYQVYTDDPKRTGFKPEPWHYSFAELSIPLLKQCVETPIEKHLRDKTVGGSELFSKEFLVDYKRDYVLGVNPLLISPDTKPIA